MTAPNREPMVETARVRALVNLCYPDDMTPSAKRQFDRMCDQVERDLDQETRS